MFDSRILDVAIGLTFIFLLLSLFSTVLVDAWIERRAWRGRMLYAKLESLLGRTLVAHFYCDSRVVSLASGKPSASARARRWLRDRTHGVIGSSSVSVPWLSAVPSVSLARARDIALSMGADRLPSYVPETVLADVLMGWLQGTGLPPELERDSSDAQRNPVPVELARLWQRFNLDVDGDQQAMRLALIAWFKQSTDRMTGEFRRRARTALLIAGSIVVVATNADALRIGQTLYDDDQLRLRLVEAAHVIERNCGSERLGGEGAAAASDGARVRVDDCRELKAKVNAGLEGLEVSGRGLLGWQTTEPARSWPDLHWVLLGWILTILAIGLGADFWFGALQKLVSVRNARRIAAADAQADSGLDSAVSDSPAPRSLPAREPLDITDATVAPLRGFQPLRFAESNVHAYWLAQFASLAYADEETLRGADLLTLHGFGTPIMLDAPDTDTQGFVLRRPDDLCIVAFRGTEARVKDIVTDANMKCVVPSKWTPEGSVAYRVHKGFHDALADVWPQLERAIADVRCPIWFTGHSLGGALAVLAAYRLHHHPGDGERRPTIGGVYTFGQPRVGDDAMLEACSTEFASRLFRYVNSTDIVPLVPPTVPATSPAYAHLGNMRYFDASGRLHHRRTLWERVGEQMLFAFDVAASHETSRSEAIQQFLRTRVADHGIARYIECLERIDAVRALWLGPRAPVPAVPSSPSGTAVPAV